VSRPKLTVKIDALYSFETLITSYQITTQCHNADDHNMNLHRLENHNYDKKNYFVALEPPDCGVWIEAPNLKTENLIMRCLTRVTALLRKW
jgi:hypothetical protein